MESVGWRQAGKYHMIKQEKPLFIYEIANKDRKSVV